MPSSITTMSLALLLAAAPLAQAASFNLLKNWQGTDFFDDDWIFYGNYDNLTNGDAVFVNRSVATADPQLAYVNSASNAIVRVDNISTVLYNDKRNTVRISSVNSYGLGSLWVMDAVHLPFGCSVWPAFWSQAALWPQGGEIDTLENVNLATVNQMALHTEPGCNASTTTSMLGSLTDPDCETTTDITQGCTVEDPRTSSYGQAFADAGGGAFATLMVEEGIFIWYFPRANMPSDLVVSNANTSPNPDNWGEPTAAYPASSCNIAQFFQPQFIILDITLCGDFAGALNIYGETCGPVPANAAANYCYTQNVIGNGTNYADAYFEVQYVRVWSNTTTAAAGNSTSSGGPGSNGTGSGSGSKSAAVPVRMTLGTTAWAGVGAVLLGAVGVLALL